MGPRLSVFERRYVSTGLMPTAWWRTRTWPGPGWGVGISSSFSTDGPPYSETRIAFMWVSLLRMSQDVGGSGVPIQNGEVLPIDSR